MPSFYLAKKGMKYGKRLNPSVVSLISKTNKLVSYFILALFSFYFSCLYLLLLATKIAATKNAAAASNAPTTGVRLSWLTKYSTKQTRSNRSTTEINTRS
jgi:hypothetical protein